MITAITMTGARPEAFALCQKWMGRQDYIGAIHWIVVDDAPERSPIDFDLFDERFEFTVLRPRPWWQHGMNTQSRNIVAGLDAVIRKDHPVAIIEDDDWYAPDWLSTIEDQMDPGLEVFGEQDATYYNVATRVERACGNKEHASLCATAIRGHGVARLRRAAKDNHKFVDVQLWRGTPDERKKLIAGDRVIGIKGMPGRDNIGIGRMLTGTEDPTGHRLKHLVGSEWNEYRRFYRP